MDRTPHPTPPHASRRTSHGRRADDVRVLDAQGAGSTITGAAGGVAGHGAKGRRGVRPGHVTVEAAALVEACESLADHAAPDATLALALTPGGLELSIGDDRAGFWETAVLRVSHPVGRLAGATDMERLLGLSEACAQRWDTVDVAIGSVGEVQVGGTDLAPRPLPPSPPRPASVGVVPQRVDIPGALPDGVPIRLPGMAVVVPGEARSRLVRRGISMANLFTDAGRWYVSGVAQGRPMYVLVAEVAVY